MPTISFATKTMSKKTTAPTTTIDYDRVCNVSSLSLFEGRIIAKKFRLIRFLSEGGMGQVWLAEQSSVRAHKHEDIPLFALKFVSKEAQHDKIAMDRVRQSYNKIVGLKHQNICTLHTLEKDDLLGWVLVMEYVHGVTLGQHVRTKPGGKLKLTEVIRLLTPVADALDYAHQMKLIHRDIKPGNIMVTPEGKPLIIDFGLAARIRNSMSITSNKPGSSGTASYKAPEQWLRGARQDARTDQYALGVVTYKLLSGVLPFPEKDCNILGFQVINTPVPPIAKMGDSINEILTRAMAKERKDRFNSCREFIDALAKLTMQSDFDEFVKKHGFDVQAVDKNGKTLLHKATERGEVMGIKFLISHGADVNAKDNNGRTPLHEILGNLSYYLSFREREILKLRYGFGDGYTYTAEEVGYIFKVTSERIHQIEIKAIGKLSRITNLTIEQIANVFVSDASTITIKSGEYTNEDKITLDSHETSLLEKSSTPKSKKNSLQTKRQRK